MWHKDPFRVGRRAVRTRWPRHPATSTRQRRHHVCYIAGFSLGTISLVFAAFSEIFMFYWFPIWSYNLAWDHICFEEMMSCKFENFVKIWFILFFFWIIHEKLHFCDYSCVHWKWHRLWHVKRFYETRTSKCQWLFKVVQKHDHIIIISTVSCKNMCFTHFLIIMYHIAGDVLKCHKNIQNS